MVGGVLPVIDEAVELDQLSLGFREADLQSLYLALPTVQLRFSDSVLEIADDRDEPGPLGRRDAQHRAADTGVLVLAR